jgi:hypothetical protein
MLVVGSRYQATTSEDVTGAKIVRVIVKYKVQSRTVSESNKSDQSKLRLKQTSIKGVKYHIYKYKWISLVTRASWQSCTRNTKQENFKENR